LITWCATLAAAPQEAEQLPYRVRDDFLSPAERSLYGVLCAAVGGWATVCPKVSLDDVFYAQNGSDVGKEAIDDLCMY